MDDNELYEPDIDREYPLKVTRNEAMYLDDTCTLMIEPMGMDEGGRIAHPIGMRPTVFSAGIMVPYDLIEKIGLAVLYTTDPDNNGDDAEIEFNASELLLLREISQSFVKIGEEQVGYNLKRKIAECLHRDTYNTKENDDVVSKLLQDIKLY